MKCTKCKSVMKEGGCFGEVYYSCPRCDWGESPKPFSMQTSIGKFVYYSGSTPPTHPGAEVAAKLGLDTPLSAAWNLSKPSAIVKEAQQELREYEAKTQDEFTPKNILCFAYKQHQPAWGRWDLIPQATFDGWLLSLKDGSGWSTERFVLKKDDWTHVAAAVRSMLDAHKNKKGQLEFDFKSELLPLTPEVVQGHLRVWALPGEEWTVFTDEPGALRIQLWTTDAECESYWLRTDIPLTLNRVKIAVRQLRDGCGVSHGA